MSRSFWRIRFLSSTGVREDGEFQETCTGTWEVLSFQHDVGIERANAYKREASRDKLRMAELAVVVMKRVTIVERRAGSCNERLGKLAMSIHSKDGNTWLAGLNRIGGISASSKDIVFNNLGHKINMVALRECFKRLDGTKAVGVDKVTKEEYGRNLEANLQSLLLRIRKGQYKPLPARIVEIPKDDGSKRPLAISCTEDKLVQMAVNEVISAIYEPLFLPCSFGFRRGKNCHDALRALNKAAYNARDGATVEIDLRSYFNTIPHKELLEFLSIKISDRRFLSLIECLIRTPTIENGKIEANKIGSPQGSILSPTLSNVFLHHVIDEWFAEIAVSHFVKSAVEIRYADDLVFVFENHAHAEKFYKVLPKRLNKYGLTLHAEKSQLLRSGTRCAERAFQAKQKIGTYRANLKITEMSSFNFWKV